MIRLKQIVAILCVISGPVFSCECSDYIAFPFISAFMVLAGVALVGIWTLDLMKGNKYDKGNGLLKMREKTTGQILIPHLIAEYSTGLCLLAGAYGLHTGKPWGRDVALLGLGALIYTSINSLSWVLTEKERYVYGIPMLITLMGSGISLTFLL